MRSAIFIPFFILPFIVLGQLNALAQPTQYPSVEKVASDFKALLQRPVVDFKPSFQSSLADSIIIEKGFINSEATERIPVLIYKPVIAGVKSFPAVICLHGTGGSKEDGDIKKPYLPACEDGYHGNCH